MSDWKRSSYCDGGHCVEVSLTASVGPRTKPSVVGIRNSRSPSTEVYFTTEDWNEFIKGVKAGEFDLL